MTRTEAKKLGLKTYTASKPCPNNHSPCERYVVDCHCVMCRKSDVFKSQKKEYRESNKEKILAGKKEYYLNNKEYCDNKSRKYAIEHRVELESWRKENYQRNKDRIKQTRKEYCILNKYKILANNAWRKAAILQRTPAWADRSLIEEFYKQAKQLSEQTGILHHVDHIIPLLGKEVSGFHVQTNLRVIPASENLSKNNKLIEELL
jgi:hypothetical protein